MEDKKNDEEKGGKSIGEGKGHAQTNRHVELDHWTHYLQKYITITI